MTDEHSLSERILDYRKRNNLTQEDLAKLLKVSFPTVNRWENGKVSPRGTTLKRIEALLEEDAASLTDEAEEQRRVSTRSMEQMLWDCACKIRGEKEAPKFKNYILPIIFLKRLSDVFDDEIEKLVQKYGDRETALTVLEADHEVVRFYLPPESRWGVISKREKFQWPAGHEPKTLGELLTVACRAVATHHDKLRGVIDVVDYNETRNNEREITDQALEKVIQTLSDPRYRLGLKDVQPDFLGRAYEYLLRKFAEGSGQSAGEFFTPTEVGKLIAQLMRPQQGEEILDYACGSAGLLIKCQLYLEENELRVAQPLKLYGQELESASYAIAWMNTVIHDMDATIMRGNSMTNPKFLRDSKDGGGLKPFDIVVANPMWNQPFDATVYEKDEFSRFEEQGGITTSKGDWAWLQHTLAHLKPGGRAAVVLDTGAVSRGSGSRNEDKEKKIRQWFVEQDIVEGVLLLPENLFYNTTAPGIIVVFNKAKPKARKGKITLVNASKRFKKGQPKNYIPDKEIRAIAEAYHAHTDVEKFVKVIDFEAAKKSDFNLSPSLHCPTSEDEVYRPLEEIVKELQSIEAEAKETDQALAQILKKLGVSR